MQGLSLHRTAQYRQFSSSMNFSTKLKVAKLITIISVFYGTRRSFSCRCRVHKNFQLVPDLRISVIPNLSSACYMPHQFHYPDDIFSLLRITTCSLFQFRIISEIMNHRQTVGLLGRVISSSQGLYLHTTTQHRKARTSIHDLSGIRNRDPVYKHSRPAPQTARPLNSHPDDIWWKKQIAGNNGRAVWGVGLDR
jgi:hypothetical protein